MKIELNTKELRLIEAGLDSRNEHNKRVMDGAIRFPEQTIKICEKECCEIEEIKKKIQNAYKINSQKVVAKEFNIPIEILENDKNLYELFLNGFPNIDISKIERKVYVTINTGERCNYGITLILICYKKDLELAIIQRILELYGSRAKVISYKELD